MKMSLKILKRVTVNQDDQFVTIQKLVDKKYICEIDVHVWEPEDDEKTIKNTIDYSIKLPNQLVQYSVFTPYPGTPIFSIYEITLLKKS